MFEKYAFRLFGDVAKSLERYFPDLPDDLKKSNIKLSSQEYIANSLFISLISFIAVLPFLSFFLSITTRSFLFSYLTSILVSIGVPASVFFIYINYPKNLVQKREKDIDKVLPFSTIYLSSVVSSGLPLSKAIRFYTEFSEENELEKELKKIVEDIEFYGLDINTAIEREIKRVPSRRLREFLYGLLSILRSGVDVYSFMKGKVAEYMADYKRRLSEFSRAMGIYIQIYLVTIMLGTIFFTILTSVVSILGGSGTQNILGLQFFLIFVLLPSVSFLFIFLVKTAEPSWE